MRISVRGWGRDAGETEVMNGSLLEAESEPERYSTGKIYKKAEYLDSRIYGRVRISTSTEVRLGGKYLLHVELSKKEIAELFFETHSGSMVQMVRDFIEQEHREDAARALERIARREERNRAQLAAQESDHS
jgi:hypothetical protein